MNLADELAKLEELRRSGALSQAEFTQAKALLLNPPSPPQSSLGEVLAGHLEEVHEQNELARIDREWELEREKYMVADRYGRRQVPTTGGSIIGGVIVVGFGIFWTIIASCMALFATTQLMEHDSQMPGSGPPPFLPVIFWGMPCFGVAFVIGGFLMCRNAYNKAIQFEKAYQRYQQRRAAFLDGR
jgi:hypothetical protein